MTLVIATALAVMCILGTPWIALGLGVAVWVSPAVGIPLVAAMAVASVVRSRRSRMPGQSESAFLQSLAGSVVAGASLREALRHSESAAVSPLARRLCQLGAPMAEIGTEVRTYLPATGDAFAVLMGMCDRTGGSIAEPIHVLAQQAGETEQQARDGRIAAAQAKFSAIVVGCVPIAIAATLVAFRGIPEPGGAIVVIPMVVGAGAMIAGAVLVFTIAQRAIP